MNLAISYGQSPLSKTSSFRTSNINFGALTRNDQLILYKMMGMRSSLGLARAFPNDNRDERFTIDGNIRLNTNSVGHNGKMYVSFSTDRKKNLNYEFNNMGAYRLDIHFDESNGMVNTRALDIVLRGENSSVSIDGTAIRSTNSDIIELAERLIKDIIHPTLQEASDPGNRALFDIHEN